MTDQTMYLGQEAKPLNNDVNAPLVNVTVRVTLTLWDFSYQTDIMIAMTSQKGTAILKSLLDQQYLMTRLLQNIQHNSAHSDASRQQSIKLVLVNPDDETMTIGLDPRSQTDLTELAEMITSLTIIKQQIV